MYLIDYIAYGLHLWYTTYIFKEMCRKPIPLHPGLGKGLNGMMWMKPVLWMFDILVSFRSGYVANGIDELRPKKVVWVLVSEPGFFKVLAHFPGN